MKYNQLGNTEIQISKICLGTMTWGEQNTEKEAHQQLDFAIEHGVNFIDTAEMYPVPPRKETQGRTEEYIGTWLKQQNNREKLIIATKACGPGRWIDHIRKGPRLNAEHIMQAVDGSLQRLQTDYIDLYQMHWPERNTNYFGQLGYNSFEDNPEDEISILETLQVLEKCIQLGKIRTIGISNETPWGVMQYLQLAKQNLLPQIVSVQNPYNLLNRTYEIGLAEISHRESVGLLAYSPLAFGTLSGKYLKEIPKGSRLDLFGDRYTRYTNSNGLQATQEYISIAQRFGLSATQMALAFINSRPFVTSNIIGATQLQQLQENIESIDIELSEEVLHEIESIHQKNSNPCP